MNVKVIINENESTGEDDCRLYYTMLLTAQENTRFFNIYACIHTIRIKTR